MANVHVRSRAARTQKPFIYTKMKPEKKRKVLSIPASWTTGKQMDKLADKLHDAEALGKCVDELLGLPSDPPLAVSTVEVLAEEDAMTNKEKLLRQAIDSGTFDMTGVLGKAWNQNKQATRAWHRIILPWARPTTPNANSGSSGARSSLRRLL